MNHRHPIKLCTLLSALLFSSLALANAQQSTTTPTTPSTAPKVEAETAASKNVLPPHSHPRDAKGLTTGKKPAKKETKVDEEKKGDEKAEAPAKGTTPHNHMRDAKGIYVAPKPAAKPEEKPASKPESK